MVSLKKEKQYLFQGCLSSSKCQEVLICRTLQGPPGPPPWPRGGRARCYRGSAARLGDAISGADWIPLGQAHTWACSTYWGRIERYGRSRHTGTRFTAGSVSISNESSLFWEGGGVQGVLSLMEESSQVLCLHMCRLLIYAEHLNCKMGMGFFFFFYSREEQRRGKIKDN